MKHNRTRRHHMPNNHIASPAQAAPVDRLTLGVQWIRPEATGIEGKVNPSTPTGHTKGYNCFEGSDE